MVWAESVATGVVTQKASTRTQGWRPVALSSVAAREFGSRGVVVVFATRLRSGIDGGGILPQVVGRSHHLIWCFIAASFELVAHELWQSA